MGFLCSLTDLIQEGKAIGLDVVFTVLGDLSNADLIYFSRHVFRLRQKIHLQARLKGDFHRKFTIATKMNPYLSFPTGKLL